MRKKLCRILILIESNSFPKSSTEVQRKKIKILNYLNCDSIFFIYI